MRMRRQFPEPQDAGGDVLAVGHARFMEKEIVDASKTQMVYNTAVQSITQNFKILKMVMRSV